MLIKRKSVRSLEKYLTGFDNNETFLVGLADLGTHENQLVDVGFTNELAVGEQVLPRVIGNKSDFNANGKENKLRNLPKVKRTKLVHSEWQDWHGSPHSGMIYREYEVYQTEFVPPPSIELSVIKTAHNIKIIKCGSFTKDQNESEDIIHAINLMLELFGECEIFTGDGARQVGKQQIKRLNWEVLPQGKYPWNKAKPIIEQIIEGINESQKHVLRHNFEAITKHEPDFVAVGKGGFSGYLICGFKHKNCFVLESTHPDNATYVFSENWQELSQLTKAEILQDNLQDHRIIHNRKWKSSINNLLK